MRTRPFRGFFGNPNAIYEFGVVAGSGGTENGFLMYVDTNTTHTYNHFVVEAVELVGVTAFNYADIHVGPLTTA